MGIKSFGIPGRFPASLEKAKVKASGLRKTPSKKLHQLFNVLEDLLAPTGALIVMMG